MDLEVEEVVHLSEGGWFNVWLSLHVEVSLAVSMTVKVLNG